MIHYDPEKIKATAAAFNEATAELIVIQDELHDVKMRHHTAEIKVAKAHTACLLALEGEKR